LFEGLGGAVELVHMERLGSGRSILHLIQHLYRNVNNAHARKTYDITIAKKSDLDSIWLISVRRKKAKAKQNDLPNPF